VNITAGDEVELMNAVYLQGPVSVCYHVADSFRDYSTGVYSEPNCPNLNTDVNHAVLAVGYGTDQASGKPYWIVKNSWGTDFGDMGYFLIERNVNMCGIAVCNSYPHDVHDVAG